MTIKEYFKEHWLVWLVTIAAALSLIITLNSCSDDGDTFIEEIVCIVPPPHCEEDCPDCTDDEVNGLLNLYYPEPETQEGFVS